ncbi:MAG: ATP-dependent protease ATPase subunit HslU [Bacillota bacterium]|jgi:ATP-dependent HslUV protease ATP-binding subunit HslU|nr:ATP-dependent protease ATPase subunit HslU [Bacillota bacterium]HHU42751.1 ATP-dependent protease ATPase subunit HslU [Clostridiales bacterium]
MEGKRMELTPKEIVKELSRYIIGQDEAKKAVAVALRNRYRRRQLPAEISDEITPKNIIMKGPTGVGKTEIARRLAKLVKAPFVKVEATKFTEVGYVGRDVESMVRDLVEVAIRLVKEEKIKEVEPKAMEVAENKIVNAIYPIRKKANPDTPDNVLKEEIKEELKKGNLDKIPVEIEVEEKPKTLQLGPIGGGMNDSNIGDLFGSLMPRRRKKRKTTVGEAFKIFVNEEANKLIDKEAINSEALKRAEQDGIIFIDEIDKITSKGGKSHGPEVSREGVQRDILPIVEGSTIATKYGNIKTDFILFIAAGAFHTSKVSDLIPELQGRFPVLVDLQSLSEEDFYKILKEPDNAIIMQYSELLKVDKIHLKFTEEAIREMARIAYLENENNENLGARRLHNVMEMLLEEVSFEADGKEDKEIIVDKEFVQKNLDKALKIMNLKKYIL